MNKSKGNFNNSTTEAPSSWSSERIAFDKIDKVFREYDVRGVYQSEIHEEFAFLLGRSFAKLLSSGHMSLNQASNSSKHIQNKKRVSIGYDARKSSLPLYKSLRDGLIQSGFDVINLGLVTSPLSYFSCFHDSTLLGSIMITGSHNPPEFNGFKISVGQQTIYGSEIQRLKNIFIDLYKNPSGFNNKEKNGIEEKIDIFTPYIKRYKQEFDLKGMCVGIDCGNGAAGCVVKRMYESCGVETHILFEEPDGNFPNHHPDPTIEKNLQDLKKLVVENKLPCGFGFDGDADRIGVVDDQGETLFADELIGLLIESLNVHEISNKKIVGDVKCSDRLYTYISKLGFEPIMWNTGHSLIKSKIKEEDSPFGGEFSGHIFFRDRNYGYDDSLYVGLRLLELKNKKNIKLSEFRKRFPRGESTPEIRLELDRAYCLKLIDTLEKNIGNFGNEVSYSKIDGIRISSEKGWFLTRLSNTQPVITLRFEGRDKNALAEIQSSFLELCQDNSIPLSFPINCPSS